MRVFDFTKEGGLSTYERIDFMGKTVNSGELIEITNNKAIIIMKTQQNNQFKCIYFYKTNAEIYKMIQNGERIDLTHCYIKDFDICEIKKYKDFKIHINSASFSFWDGDINFREAYFENANFREAIFGDGDIIFAGANFERDVDFIQTSFGNGKLDFHQTSFKNVNFYGANIGSSDVCFTVAYFDGRTCFSEAIFRNGNINFKEAQFKNEDVSFEKTVFGDGEINFWGVDFIGLTFMGAIFGDGLINFNYINMDKGNADFRDTNFGTSKISFESASIDTCVMNNNVFKSLVNLKFRYINKLIIENCIIENVLEITGNPKQLSFINTINLGHIYMNWNNWNVLRNEDNMYTAINSYYKHRHIFDMPIKANNEEKANQFRMLKENFHNTGYYEEEDEAYRQYMKYKPREWIQKPVKVLGLIGGYGTKPKSILLTMLMVWLIFSFVFAFNINKEKMSIQINSQKATENAISEIVTNFKENTLLVIDQAIDRNENGILANEVIMENIYNNLQVEKNISEKDTIRVLKQERQKAEEYIRGAERRINTYRDIARVIKGKKNDSKALSSLLNGIYYSGITFLTIGYGDIYPICYGAKIAAIIEGFIGLFLMSYLTVAVVRKILR